jgi:radical SAM superfamily enzyme YgiQ (UPF0313 family)
MKNIALVMVPVFWSKLPPLGITSLKGYLRDKGIMATCLDYNNILYQQVPDQIKKEWDKSCNRGFESDIMRYLNEIMPDEIDKMFSKLENFEIVAFSCFKSNIKTVEYIANRLKKKKPDIKILLGGPEIGSIYFRRGDIIDRSDLDFADLLVVGEGEQALRRFIESDGRCFVNRVVMFDEIKVSSEFVAPDYSDLDFHKYPRKNSASIIYGRGCIRKCKFCTERLLYQQFKVAAVDTVICQIKKHLNEGREYFIFHDSMINSDLHALELLLDSIIEKFGKIQWEAQLGIRKDMENDLFRKIKMSGCYNLFVGLESGSDSTLTIMNKGYKAVEAERFFMKLNENQLNFGISMITGFPGETEEAFMDSIDFVIKNKKIIPKIEQVNPFVYYDGLEFDNAGENEYTEVAMDRAERFIDMMDREGFRYTPRFVMNLCDNS